MKQLLGTEFDFQRVHPDYFKVLRLSTLIGYGIFIVPAAVLAVLFRDTPSAFYTFLIIVLILVILLVITLVFARRRAAVIGYCKTDAELVIRKGIMFQKLSVVPYGRMQQVNVSTGPLLGRFNLTKVALVTASAETNAEIPGISREEAELLRAELAQLGNAQMEGL